MRLARAEIRQMPGLAEGYTLEGLESVVVLLGPNGSGKSTLRRALVALLWPSREPSLEVDLRFEWHDARGTLVSVRRGREVGWSREGEPCDPPELPAADLAAAFSFGSEDLVAGDETAREQARAVAAELAGGYDLEPLIASRSISGGSQRRAHTAWSDARQEVTRLQRERTELAGAERELATLEAELEEATRASVRLPLLRDRLRLARALEQETESRARLAGFPEGMDALRGDEWEQLEKLDQERALALKEQGQATVRTRRAESEAAKIALDPTIDAARLKNAFEALDDMRRVEERCSEDEAQLEGLQKRRDEAAARLGGEGPPPHLSSEDAGRIHFLLESRWQLRREELAIEGELAVLEKTGAPASDPELLRQAGHDLRASLAGVRGLNLVWWVLSLISAALAGAAAWAFFEGAWRPSSLPAALGSLALAALFTWLGRRPSGRSALLALLDDAGIQGPRGWSRTSLEGVLREVDKAIAAEEARERAGSRRDALEARRRELGTRRTALDDEREALTRGCGLDPGLRDLELHELAQALRSWRTLHDDAERAESVVVGRRRRKQELAESILSLLRTAEIAGESNSASLRVALDRLQTRFDNVRSLEEEAREARDDADRAAADIRRIDEARESLLERAGLRDDELDELRRRVEVLEDYREARSALEQARGALAAARASAGDDAAPGDVATLEREIAELERLAAPEKGLRDEVAARRTRIRDARQEHVLEDALAREESARAEVAAERDLELDGALGALLLRRAARTHATSAMPPRLAHANELLGEFTAHRFALELQGDPESEYAFVARDVTENRLVPLDKLSSGIRGQLLLAARVAFASGVEGAEPLPLFLDETLSQADPERFRAVAQALAALARAGRQIFYLTCQPADAELWRDEAAEDVSLGVHDLAELRRLAWRSEVPAHALKLREIPMPAGMRPDEYARALGVAPLDPFREAAAADLFHALPDRLEELHALLEAGVERVGPWRGLDEEGLGAALVGGERGANQVRVRVRALEGFLAAWRQGRGRPLDPAALQEAGVSETFFDQVVALAEREEWDAARLIAALRDKQVKRFRQQAIDDLEDHFLETGAIDAQTILKEEGLRQRLFTELQTEIEAGEISAKALSALLERWFAAVSPRAAYPG